MPTPVGHTLAAVTIAASFQRPNWLKTSWYFAAVILIANLPDCDFIPGYLSGDPVRFHWGAAHSITAALLAGVITGLVCWKWRGQFLRPALIASIAWASHIFLDMLFGPVQGAPFGLEVFWPLSERRVMLPWSVFILYPGDAIRQNPFTALLHARVWPLVLRELVVLAPFATIALLVRFTTTRFFTPSSLPRKGEAPPGTAADA